MLEGRTALVTGASRGIGRATADRLAAAGALVGVHYGSNEAAAKDVVAGIEATGGNAFLVHAPLGGDGDAAAVLRGLDEGLDGRSLDVLVCNAGTLDATPLEQVSRRQFDDSFAVNVRAPFFVTQALLPRLADGGRIVFVSSAVTRIASRFVHYAMAKGALEAFSRTLANMLGRRGITVNTVAPGVVDTDMGAWVDSAPGLRAAVESTIAHGRIGQPADVADVVTFLASDEARWITGETIDVSGGQWLGPLGE